MMMITSIIRNNLQVQLISAPISITIAIALVKNIKVIDARTKEIGQSNQKVDNTKGQGIVGNPKKKKVYSLFIFDHKQDIPASV